MKGYFARKPENIGVLKGTIGEARRASFKPVEITPIAEVKLEASQYTAFCKEMLNYWEFFAPYTEKSTFTGDHTANCVMVEAEGQPTIAVCLEGYGYPRYAALVLEDEEPSGMIQPSIDPEERHIRSLENNGVRIKKPDGSTEPVSMEFYRRAVELCKAGGCNAITYSLVLPGIEGDFSIAVWRTGHVDSGTTTQVLKCLDR